MDSIKLTSLRFQLLRPAIECFKRSRLRPYFRDAAQGTSSCIFHEIKMRPDAAERYSPTLEMHQFFFF
jgi:hypothetical protein